MTYGISLDIGTSGTRGHAVELETGKIISTSVTECHPLPGANIMDHLTFCINVGTDVAHKILIDTVNKLIATMGVDLKQVETPFSSPCSREYLWTTSHSPERTPTRPGESRNRRGTPESSPPSMSDSTSKTDANSTFPRPSDMRSEPMRSQ